MYSRLKLKILQILTNELYAKISKTALQMMDCSSFFTKYFSRYPTSPDSKISKRGIVRHWNRKVLGLLASYVRMAAGGSRRSPLQRSKKSVALSLLRNMSITYIWQYSIRICPSRVKLLRK